MIRSIKQYIRKIKDKLCQTDEWCETFEQVAVTITKIFIYAYLVYIFMVTGFICTMFLHFTFYWVHIYYQDTHEAIVSLMCIHIAIWFYIFDHIGIYLERWKEEYIRNTNPYSKVTKL